MFKNPDEGAHYLRAYEIASSHYLNSKGHIGSDISCNEYVTIAKKYAPIAYYQEHAERGGESCYVKTINSASTYPPTAYIFLASMIKAGHVFDLSIEKTAVLCRVINGLFCFILIYIAINRMSHAKYLMFGVLFSPMVMVMLSAVSAR